MFSLLGSDRSARAASEASSATSGLSAWRASSRLRKSTGVFCSIGSPFSLSLMSAPSPVFAALAPSPQLAVRRGPFHRREALHALAVRQEVGEDAVRHRGLVGRYRVRQRRDRLPQVLLGRELPVALI